jgi:hypothetical protein
VWVARHARHEPPGSSARGVSSARWNSGHMFLSVLLLRMGKEEERRGGTA